MGEERKIFMQGIRVVHEGRRTLVYDIQTGDQVPYVTRFAFTHDAPSRFVSVQLEIDVPRLEYEGPADLIARLWPSDEMLAEAERAREVGE